MAAALLSLVAFLSAVHSAGAAAVAASADYPPAAWVPADPANYTVSNRPVNYQVDMIVIHDIEGTAADAITAFQDPNRHGSAHYVIGQDGLVTQMVAEKDVAWHAGNWYYNTRSIGIEHEGFACCPYFTAAEYLASAQLSASICSRWGVPLDRSHVIGHNQVPDPNDPTQFGGEEHHTDPGPYWDWPNYLSLAQSYASSLPSPPHMGPNPVAASEEGGVMLSWRAAQSCHDPITAYSVIGQPGNITISLRAGSTSVWIPGLTDGVSYSFSVTAFNAQGQSTLTSNVAIPGPACTAARLTASPAAPQVAGGSIAVTAASTGCNSAEYAFWVRTPEGTWTLQRDYGSAAWSWNTVGLAPGTYELGVWARQAGSGRRYDAFAFSGFALGAAGCLSTALAPSVAPPQPSGTVVTFNASSTACSSPRYQFWLLPPGGAWTVVQPYGVGNTWAFDSSRFPGGGNFQVGVWARQAGSPNAYDTFHVTTYWIRSGAGCVVFGLSGSPVQPQAVGTTVNFAPQQVGCSKQYQFWLLPPGGSWGVVQAYGAGTTWAWNTSGYGAGVYEVGVWEGSSATPGTYESYAITTFTLGVATCTSGSMAPDLDPPQAPGSTVTFTASSTGCAAPQYQFWLLPPGGTWTVKQPYGGATWSWTTAGLSPGTYQVGVWARQPGSTASYDAYFIGTYQLVVAACTSATLSATPVSPQAPGTRITFTATSTGCASPQYQFWGRAPGGVWTLIQAFGPGTTFSWDTTGSPSGAYSVAVWAAATGSNSDYDTYAITSFSLS